MPPPIESRPSRSGSALWRLILLLIVLPGPLAAQTVIEPPSNKYSPQDDVTLGEEAAAEVLRQMPLLANDAVESYVEALGDRLVSSIPAAFRHPEFHYSFRVVDVDDINAFALPGGPMFLNRGMIVAAKSEAEVAGVMAHELSHVALRHGTAQATKAGKYQAGAVAGAIIGAIIGGATGRAVSEGTQFGIGTVFLKFSREYEKQADLLGAQIMARTGYDPRALATMFQTIEEQGGSGGPQWLSDHPSPGNRVDYITEEARHLQVVNAVRDSSGFDRTQATLQALPTAGTGGATRTGARAPRDPSRPTPPYRPGSAGAPDPPSSRHRTYDGRGLYTISVPQNWEALATGDDVTFAPERGYFRSGDQSAFTHGVQVGLTRSDDRDLYRATETLIAGLTRTNPNLRARGTPQPRRVANRGALVTDLTNLSETTGQAESIEITTLVLPDGDLFYVIAVAPRDQFATYEATFDRVVQSIRLTGRR